MFIEKLCLLAIFLVVIIEPDKIEINLVWAVGTSVELFDD